MLSTNAPELFPRTVRSGFQELFVGVLGEPLLLGLASTALGLLAAAWPSAREAVAAAPAISVAPASRRRR